MDSQLRLLPDRVILDTTPNLGLVALVKVNDRFVLRLCAYPAPQEAKSGDFEADQIVCAMPTATITGRSVVEAWLCSSERSVSERAAGAVFLGTAA